MSITNHPLAVLIKPWVKREYQSVSDEKLTALANDVLDGKVTTTEGIDPQLCPFVFPRIGAAMALLTAQEQGQINTFFMDFPKELMQTMLQNAQAVMTELRTNKAVMIYNYNDRSIPLQHRTAPGIALPKELEKFPMFDEYFFLSEDDTARFCDIRDRLFIERQAKEAGVSPDQVIVLDKPAEPNSN